MSGLVQRIDSGVEEALRLEQRWLLVGLAQNWAGSNSILMAQGEEIRQLVVEELGKMRLVFG